MGGCKPGDAKATKAYKLDNKYIIHTVGPKYYFDLNPAKILENSYRNCLKLADSLGLESIAFCSISTGVYGYPYYEAAQIAANVIINYKPKSLKQAYMCIFPNKKLVDIYKAAFNKRI